MNTGKPGLRGKTDRGMFKRQTSKHCDRASRFWACFWCVDRCGFGGCGCLYWVVWCLYVIWNIRLEVEEKARWQAGASVAGVSLAAFVRSCVEAGLAGGGATGSAEVPSGRRDGISGGVGQRAVNPSASALPVVDVVPSPASPVVGVLRSTGEVVGLDAEAFARARVNPGSYDLSRGVPRPEPVSLVKNPENLKVKAGSRLADQCEHRIPRSSFCPQCAE